MDAKELRIGNHTSHGKITAFERDRVYFGGVWNWINELKPIPLTEDILVKCGFDFSHNRYSPRIGKFVLETGDDGYIIFIIDDYINVKHLHQLQNLYFALTGEELNVQL